MNKRAGKKGDRTALLIYCTREEAEKIKGAAKLERRTITGFVMRAVMNRLEAMHRAEAPEIFRKSPEEPGRANPS